MDHEAFLAQIDQLAPGHGLGPGDPLDGLRPYQRLAITRWLSDCLEQPTDLAVVRQLATLDDAWRWLAGALGAGERLRRLHQRSTPGATTRIRLRPLLDDDLAPLYVASLDPELSSAWRYRGRMLPADEFVATLADGVWCQFVVELVASGEAVGLVSAYDHHQAGQHCKLAFVRFGRRVPGDESAVLEGFAAFTSHLFRTYPYRKLYVELPACNLGLLEPEIFEVEGVLRDYLFHGGRPMDLYVASLSRPRWQELSDAAGW